MKLRVILACLMTFTLGGCVSFLTNKKVELEASKTEGVRYSLPIPVLQFTPAADGTVALSVLYLPDPENTYALDTSSLFGSYTFDVKVKEGLLEAVGFNTGASAAGEQLLNSAASIEKAEIDAASKAAETASKQAEATAKALLDARMALGVAEAKLAKLTELGATKEQLNAAELALIEARTKLLILEADASSKLSGFNAVGEEKPVAAGPIFFRLVPSEKSEAFDLIASAQIIQETSFAAQPAVPPVSVAFQFNTDLIVRPTEKGLAMTLKSNQALKGILREAVLLTKVDEPDRTLAPPLLEVRVEKGETFIDVAFADGTPVGRYSLEIPVTNARGVREQPEAKVFEIGPKLPK